MNTYRLLGRNTRLNYPDSQAFQVKTTWLFEGERKVLLLPFGLALRLPRPWR